MNRAAYRDEMSAFVDTTPDTILGRLVEASSFAIELAQRDAWSNQIQELQQQLTTYRGRGAIFFEWAIPRLGKRIDVVLIIGQVVLVVAYKVGAGGFDAHATDQVCDYALDIKNFHESSHDVFVAPVLIATQAQNPLSLVSIATHLLLS